MIYIMNISTPISMSIRTENNSMDDIIFSFIQCILDEFHNEIASIDIDANNNVISICMNNCFNNISGEYKSER